MEAITARVCASMGRRGREKRYQRLNCDLDDVEDGNVAVVHGSFKRKKDLIIAEIHRLKFKIISPVKALMKKSRDAYVEAMLCFEQRVARLNAGNVFLGRRVQLSCMVVESVDCRAGCRGPNKM